MMELPIAICMKEHYSKLNTAFTDSERATIFWNSRLPLTDKLTALREILDTTDDDVLKDQIKTRLKMEEETIEAFQYCDKDYVHLVILDDEDGISRVFSSVDAAVEYGKQECEENFRVIKEILDDQVDSGADERTLLGGEAGYRKDGTLVFCSCYNSREYDVVLLNTVRSDGFEEAYIPVLNPFEYGDIVRIRDGSRLAIVVTSQQQWNERCERRKCSDMPLNYYLNTLTVEFLHPDGEFCHDHPDIFDLEKVEEWEDEAEWKLMQSISALMKGEGWIESVFKNYRNNRE